MQIQSNLASTIAMAFDECPSSVADKNVYGRILWHRTTRWLKRCKDEMATTECTAGYDQPTADAVWHQPGRYLRRYPY